MDNAEFDTGSAIILCSGQEEFIKYKPALEVEEECLSDI